MPNSGKINSIVKGTCPHCREEKMFKNRNLYNFKSLGDMHKYCPKCNENLSPEPGFYFGAAYVSYGLTVAMWTTIVLGLYLLNSWGAINFELTEKPWQLFAIGIGSLLLLFPLIYRLSRVIWAHIFIK